MSDPKQRMPKGEAHEPEADEAAKDRHRDPAEHGGDTPETSAAKKGGTLKLNMSDTDLDFSDPGLS